MLGWIAADSGEATEALDRARSWPVTSKRAIAARAIVFSTGPEVVTGQIHDTNKPWITRRLSESGFTVTEGRDLPDDLDAIAAAVRGKPARSWATDSIVTTGGVGAEGKDGTVEALLSVDPEAATPTLFAVEQGHGRHVKARVRIGVGEVGTAIVACLPGPHAEATVGADALITALATSRDNRRDRGRGGGHAARAAPSRHGNDPR